MVRDYWVLLAIQEKDLIRLKREAKLKGGFYVDPEAKLLFIVRIRGYVLMLDYTVTCILMLNVLVLLVLIFVKLGTYSINAMHPKTRKILQLLRLRQVV